LAESAGHHPCITTRDLDSMLDTYTTTR